MSRYHELTLQKTVKSCIVFTYGSIGVEHMAVEIVKVLGNVGKVGKTLSVLACAVHIPNFMVTDEIL